MYTIKPGAFVTCLEFLNERKKGNEEEATT